jgi:arylsulfatase A
MDLSNKTIGNMMQDAGYSTCYAGKWQLSGFETSVHTFGFDKYSIWEPGKEKDAGNRYKSPHIYEGGKFLPDSVTLNKYADDWFTDYIFNFISKASNPYFVYYSMNLCHSPFCPTPDDAAFAAWDPSNGSDPVFFPSMVKYMDKKIGELLDSVSSNTVIIYVGDNGTPTEVNSKWNGISIQGAKGKTTVYGTHVPLIVYRKGYAPYMDTSLVDFTDFLPTLASIANIPVPTTYGILDGTPFYPQLGKREWIFCHFQPYPDRNPENLNRWVQNSVYKKYGEATNKKKVNNLYNTVLDPFELKPIMANKQSAEEKAIDSSFSAVLQNMHN